MRTQGKTGYWFRSLYVLPRQTDETESGVRGRGGREGGEREEGAPEGHAQGLGYVGVPACNIPTSSQSPALNQNPLPVSEGV